jgi:hypothetical protein
MIYTENELEINRLVSKIALEEELSEVESKRLEELCTDREWTGYVIAKMREDGTIDITTMHYLGHGESDFGSYPLKPDDSLYQRIRERHNLQKPGDESRINQRYENGEWVDVDD